MQPRRAGRAPAGLPALAGLPAHRRACLR